MCIASLLLPYLSHIMWLLDRSPAARIKTRGRSAPLCYYSLLLTTSTSPSRPRTVASSHRRGEMARALDASDCHCCHLAVFLLRSLRSRVALFVLLVPYVVLWTSITPNSFRSPYGSQRSFSRASPPLGAVVRNCSVGTSTFVASSASGPLPWVGPPGRVPGLLPPSWCTPGRLPPGVLDHWLSLSPLFLVSPGVRALSGVHPGLLPGLLLSAPPDCTT